MSKQRAPYECPTSGNSFSLPPNLYPHARLKEGKWRYKGTEGIRDLNHYAATASAFIAPEQAIKAALMLNDKFYPDSTSANSLAKKNNKLRILYQDFEPRYREMLSGTTKEYIIVAFLYLNRFVSQLEHIPMDKIDLNVLRDLFNGEGQFSHIEANGHNQRNENPHKAKFIDFLHSRKALPALDNMNPYITKGWGFYYKKVVKQRKRLELATFKETQQIARDQQFEYIADYADLALLTMMRITDIARLTWAENFDESRMLFGAVNSKKENLTGKKVLYQFRLNDLPVLKALVLKLKDRADEHKNQYVIFNYQQKRKQNNGPYGDRKAEVFSSLSSRAFTRFLLQTPSMAKVADGENPTFHEIKSLAVRLHKASKDLSMQEISDFAGHGNAAFTETKYGKDDYADIVHVTKVIDVRGLPDNFLELQTESV